MSRINSFIGKTAIHKELGKVEVLSRIDGSRTKVNIRCIQRAEGWNEDMQRYERYKAYSRYQGTGIFSESFQWHTNREENDQYGHEDYCHIKDLTIIETEEL